MAAHPLSENILQVTSLDKYGEKFGPVKTIVMEEFLFRQEKYDEARGPKALKLSMVTYEMLATMLEEEFDMNEETWATWAVYFQPPVDDEDDEDEARKVDSDISLRSAIKLLRTSGNLVLPLLMRGSHETDSEDTEEKEAEEDNDDNEDSQDEGVSEDEAESKKDGKLK
jgi:hypothetical protein